MKALILRSPRSRRLEGWRRAPLRLRPSFETPTFGRLLRVCERFSPYGAATPRLQLIISCRQNTTIMVVLFSIKCSYACLVVRNRSVNGKYFYVAIGREFQKIPCYFPCYQGIWPRFVLVSDNIKCVGLVERWRNPS